MLDWLEFIFFFYFLSFQPQKHCRAATAVYQTLELEVNSNINFSITAHDENITACKNTIAQMK